MLEPLKNAITFDGKNSFCTLQDICTIPHGFLKTLKIHLHILFYIVAKFSSSGREDVDVRTLGRGRPFMFEIVNSRKVNFTPEELLEVQKDINKDTKDIFIRDLQKVNK